MLVKYFLLVVTTIFPNVYGNIFPRATPSFFNTTQTTSSSSSSTPSHDGDPSTIPSSSSSQSDVVAPNLGFPNPALSALSTANQSSTRTTSAPGNLTTPAVCCFLVQDTVNEEYWNISSYSSTYSVVNVTKFTTHMTLWPNLTTSSIEKHTYLTNHSFLFSFPVGINPITNFDNYAPKPTEISHSHNGTALVTGGITIPSPAAFYVFSTVKIITASQVTDELGNPACATQSGDFNVNQYAEAYFGGGADIVGYSSSVTSSQVATETNTYTFYDDSGSERLPTSTETVTGVYTYKSYETFFTDSYGSRVEVGPRPSGVVISLATPFIYQPDRGKTGATSSTGLCGQRNPSKDDFGYIPKVFFDFLKENEQYSSQYPGLESCNPGGPSIWQPQCAGFTTTIKSTIGTSTLTMTSFVTPPGNVPPPPPGYQTASGTDLTEETIIYAGTPSVGPSKPTEPPKNAPSAIPVAPPETKPAAIQPPAKSPQSPQNTQPPDAPVKPPGVGSIINSIFEGPPNRPDNPPAKIPPSNPQPRPIAPPNVIIPSPTTIPINAVPPGLGGQTTEINGETFVVVPKPTTFAAIAPSPGAIPGASATIINGSPFIVITSSTKIPVANAPPGLTGEVTTINNTPFVIIPGATTIAAAPPRPVAPPPAFGGRTTVIDGSTFLAIPGPTTIPVVGAPPGLTGSLTLINNTPFIIVPGPTNIPLPAGSGSSLGTTTLINGTPFLVIPSATSIVLSLAPSGLTGSTTTINGTPFLVIPSATVIALPNPAPTNLPGSTTVVDGTTKIILTGPTTIPVNPNFSVDGSTTVIDGTTMVIISSATTVPLQTASVAKLTSSSKPRSSSQRTSSQTSTSLPSTTLVAPAASTSAKKNNAPSIGKTADGGMMYGIMIGLLVKLILL